MKRAAAIVTESSCRTSNIESPYFKPKKIKSKRLLAKDFDKPCHELAKFLLGKIFVRNSNETLIKGKIVETESYPGGDDRCSHSYKGKETKKNKAMFMGPGTLYVYITYGMYFCANISCKEYGGAVLIRAVEPLQGLEWMREERIKNKKKKTTSSTIKDTHLCNGPSKFCQAFSINKDLNEENLISSSIVWVENERDIPPSDIITTTRIGLSNYKWKEWVEKPFRFYVHGNKHVSVRDKKKEMLLISQA